MCFASTFTMKDTMKVVMAHTGFYFGGGGANIFDPSPRSAGE